MRNQYQQAMVSPGCYPKQTPVSAYATHPLHLAMPNSGAHHQPPSPNSTATLSLGLSIHQQAKRHPSNLSTASSSYSSDMSSSQYSSVSPAPPASSIYAKAQHGIKSQSLKASSNYVPKDSTYAVYSSSSASSSSGSTHSASPTPSSVSSSTLLHYAQQQHAQPLVSSDQIDMEDAQLPLIAETPSLRNIPEQDDTDEMYIPAEGLSTSTVTPVTVEQRKGASPNNSFSYTQAEDEIQNDRFFASNTLYKRELKQKQREFMPPNVSASPTSISASYLHSRPASFVKSPHVPHQPIIASGMTSHHHVNPKAFTLNNQPYKSASFSNGKPPPADTKPKNHNKMLHMFSNFLHRNKTATPSPAMNSNSTSKYALSSASTSSMEASTDLNEHGDEEEYYATLNSTLADTSVAAPSNSSFNSSMSSTVKNYLNFKHLKRAASSTHFGSSSNTGSSCKQTNKTPTPTPLFNPSSLFQQRKMSTSGVSKTTSAINLATVASHSNKMRRSVDNMVAAEQVTSTVIPTTAPTIVCENTSALSTKNNGLLFSPPRRVTEHNSSQGTHSGAEDKENFFFDYNGTGSNHQKTHRHSSIAETADIVYDKLNTSQMSTQSIRPEFRTDTPTSITTQSPSSACQRSSYRQANAFAAMNQQSPPQHSHQDAVVTPVQHSVHYYQAAFNAQPSATPPMPSLHNQSVNHYQHSYLPSRHSPNAKPPCSQPVSCLTTATPPLPTAARTHTVTSTHVVRSASSSSSLSCNMPTETTKVAFDNCEYSYVENMRPVSATSVAATKLSNHHHPHRRSLEFEHSSGATASNKSTSPVEMDVSSNSSTSSMSSGHAPHLASAISAVQQRLQSASSTGGLDVSFENRNYMKTSHLAETRPPPGTSLDNNFSASSHNVLSLRDRFESGFCAMMPPPSTPSIRVNVSSSNSRIAAISPNFLKSSQTHQVQHSYSNAYQSQAHLLRPVAPPQSLPIINLSTQTTLSNNSNAPLPISDEPPPPLTTSASAMSLSQDHDPLLSLNLSLTASSSSVASTSSASMPSSPLADTTVLHVEVMQQRPADVASSSKQRDQVTFQFYQVMSERLRVFCDAHVASPHDRFVLVPKCEYATDESVSQEHQDVFRFSLDFAKPIILAKLNVMLRRSDEESHLEGDLSGMTFHEAKEKLTAMLNLRSEYLNDETTKTLQMIDANDKLGHKILKFLETDSTASASEVDKFKLLVNENDVINNLLLKLCNKLATTGNSIQILRLKQDAWKQQNGSEKSSEDPYSEEMDLLKQEIIQIQRKKEEAVFLKHGIDKRATFVTEFLRNYLNENQLEEFELFMQLKSTHAMQLRHIHDHSELVRLQLQLLRDLRQASDSIE